MKSLLALAILATSFQTFAQGFTCYADKAIQSGAANLKADAQIIGDMDKETKILSNVVGHIFVQHAYADGADISIENSYMGFFSIQSVPANPDYRPNTYKGFSQFRDFDAIHTAGQESGMWGELVMDLTKADNFQARYIFKAGDHMGGTVLMKCIPRKAE